MICRTHRSLARDVLAPQIHSGSGHVSPAVVKIGHRLLTFRHGQTQTKSPCFFVSSPNEPYRPFAQMIVPAYLRQCQKGVHFRMPFTLLLSCPKRGLGKIHGGLLVSKDKLRTRQV